MSNSLKDIPVVTAEGDKDAHNCAELEPFALRVIGDSMTPEFLDGHVIVLDPGATPSQGAFVVVEIGGEIVFRQYCVDGERRWLRALREGYPEHELVGVHRLIGVVTERVGVRRHDRKRYG